MNYNNSFENSEKYQPIRNSKTCKMCKKHRAVFFSISSNAVRSDCSHDLCPQCFRKELDRYQSFNE